MANRPRKVSKKKPAPKKKRPLPRGGILGRGIARRQDPAAALAEQQRKEREMRKKKTRR